MRERQKEREIQGENEHVREAYPIHQKYNYIWNNSYRTPTEHWQKTSDFPKGKKLPM